MTTSSQPRCAQTPACRWKATSSAITPRVTAATQAPRDGDRAAASDAVLRRKLTALGAIARRVAERARLTSRFPGLKPDWPPRTATAGIAPAALSAGSCRCSRSRVTAAAGRTSDLLQACRMTSVRTSANRPANRAFFLKPPTIGGPRVRNQSDRMQRNKATVATKKTCKCRLFTKRLKGFEPSTFCMASSCSRLHSAAKYLQIRAFRREIRSVQDDLARGRGDGARVREFEISGFGSSATWKRGRS